MDSANPLTGQQARPTVPSAPDDAWRGIFAIPAGPVGPPRPSGREAFRRSVPQLLREPFSRAAWRAAWRQGAYTVLGLLLWIPGFLFIVVAVTAGSDDGSGGARIEARGGLAVLRYLEF